MNSNDIIQLSQDEIWVATENEGLLFYNRRTHAFDYSYSIGTSKYTIPRNFVSKFYKDISGNIWITQQSGLTLFQAGNIIFRSLSFSEKNVFSGSFLSNRENLICLKSNSVASINTKSGEVAIKTITLPLPPNTIPSCAIMYSPEDYMLFFNDNFFSVNSKSFQTTKLPLLKHKVDSSFFKHFRIVECIADTIDNRKEYILLAKTVSGNILLNYNPDNGELTEYTPGGFKKGSLNYQYTKIIKVSNGKYWISTLDNGLLYVDKRGGTIKYSAAEVAQARKIPRGEINDFTVTDNGIWLLINKKGLVHILFNNAEISSYETFDEKNGLIENRLQNIITDNNNNLWITTNSALFLFRMQQKDFLRYSVANGLGNIKFHVNEVVMTCTSNGNIGLSDKYSNITWFNPSANATSAAPALVLNNISVNNQILHINNTTDEIVLRPNQNHVSFFHDIIDFDKTAFYKIMYKLENFDAKWNIANQSNGPSYTQLPAGNYI